VWGEKGRNATFPISRGKRQGVCNLEERRGKTGGFAPEEEKKKFSLQGEKHNGASGREK